MVVRNDDCSSGIDNRRFEYLSRVHNGRRETSDRHEFHCQHVILGREQHRIEVLAVGISEKWAEKSVDVLRPIDAGCRCMSPTSTNGSDRVSGDHFV